VGISGLTTDDQYRTSGHRRRDNRYDFQPNLINARRLAWWLTTILPAMRLAEALETRRLHRVAGLTGPRTALVTTRPCHAPPRTTSAVGVIGGGQLPRLREGSRAHHGILFLDELPEFRRHVLEVLRQPLEVGVRGKSLSGVAHLAGLAVLAARRPTEGTDSCRPTPTKVGTKCGLSWVITRAPRHRGEVRADPASSLAPGRQSGHVGSLGGCPAVSHLQSLMLLLILSTQSSPVGSSRASRSVVREGLPVCMHQKPRVQPDEG
jgi:hypothetical protein